jgi:hypothetical protein
MASITTKINIGKYLFQIIDNTLALDGQIYCRKLKIGDCINVSISYNQNRPVSASITHISYDLNCSIIMIKTLLDYIHQQIPTITEITFEDKTSIECANIYHIPLYYFSIAFNGVTWYENHFNARQKDLNKHDKYRTKINILLYSEEFKQNTYFIHFLEIAKPPFEIIDELDKYYSNSITFGEFFQSMPKSNRCRLVRDWIFSFMSYHLKEVFENMDWIIELPISTFGGLKNTRKYYYHKCKIIYNKIFGIDDINR